MIGDATVGFARKASLAGVMFGLGWTKSLDNDILNGLAMICGITTAIRACQVLPLMMRELGGYAVRAKAVIA